MGLGSGMMTTSQTGSARCSSTRKRKDYIKNGSYGTISLESMLT